MEPSSFLNIPVNQVYQSIIPDDDEMLAKTILKNETDPLDDFLNHLDTEELEIQKTETVIKKLKDKRESRNFFSNIVSLVGSSVLASWPFQEPSLTLRQKTFLSVVTFGTSFLLTDLMEKKIGLPVITAEEKGRELHLIRLKRLSEKIEALKRESFANNAQIQKVIKEFSEIYQYYKDLSEEATNYYSGAWDEQFYKTHSLEATNTPDISYQPVTEYVTKQQHSIYGSRIWQELETASKNKTTFKKGEDVVKLYTE